MAGSSHYKRPITASVSLSELASSGSASKKARIDVPAANHTAAVTGSASASASAAVGNFGVMIHWGLYSVPAFDSVVSARRRHIQNGSEWYAKRLTVTPTTYRPT